MLIIVQVWSFAPPPDEYDDTVVIESASSTPGIGSTADDNDLTVHPRRRTLFSDPPPAIPGSDADQPMPDAPS